MPKRSTSKFLCAAAAVTLAALFSGPSTANAQELIGSYTAFIGDADLSDAKGARLTKPWQVLRQDRANFHRYGISQSGDEFDPFFGSIRNRKAMEKMVNNGTVDPRAARVLLEGGAVVFVRIFGSGDTGTSVTVAVAQ